MSQSLYKISEEYKRMLEELEFNGGEITEEIADRLIINRDELEDKCVGYFYHRKKLKGEIDVIKEEIERLQAQKASRERTIEHMNEALTNAVILYGDEGKSGNHKLKIGNLTLYTKITKSVDVLNLDVTGENTDKDYLYVTLPKISYEKYEEIQELLDDETVYNIGVIVNKKKAKDDLLNEDLGNIKGLDILEKEGGLNIR